MQGNIMKILHCADLHLDSPFRSGSAEKSEVRRRELRGTFSSLILYIKTEGIKLALLAGDLFDSSFVTKETAAFVIKEIASVPDCQFVIAPGNHDPFTEDSVYSRFSFGENVYVFPRAMLSHFYFEKLNTYVYGYAFENDSLRHCPFAGYRTEDPGAYNILLGHGEFAPDTKYCPLNVEHIAAFGADYTALGHVHNAPDPFITEGLAYAHCGCVEGRGFDEPGVKGALYVEIEKAGEDASVTCEKLRFGRRRYEKIKVNVDGMTSLSEVENAIATAVEAGEFGSDTLLRVTLTGRVAPTVILSEALLAARIEGVFYAEVKDRTLPLYDIDYLKADPSVKGEFCRLLLPALEGEDEEARSLATMALRYGLAAITGEDLTELADEEGTDAV